MICVRHTALTKLRLFPMLVAVAAAAGAVAASVGAQPAAAVNGRIAFVSYWAPNLAPQVYRLDLRTGRQRLLTFGPASNDGPVVSPDGRTVLFRTSADNFQTIWAMRADGTGKHSLVSAGSVADGEPPAWSPDSRRVAFVDQLGRIAWLDIGSGAVHTLVPGGLPTWSPDGRTVAYVNDDTVMAIGADGSDERPLAPGIEFSYAGNAPKLSWSPDGRRVVFAGAEGLPLGDVNGGQIIVAPADGYASYALTTGAADIDPQWSPDGRAIAFVRTGGSTSRVLVVPAGGGRPVVIGRPPTWASDRRPVWSRDGRFIAVDRTFQESDGLRALVVIPRNGGRPRTVVRFPSHAILVDEDTLAWSPDGAFLYYSDGRDGSNNRSIYTINPDGSGLRRLTNDRIDAYDPAFSPDGKTIAFVRTLVANGGIQDPELYLMNADGSHVRRLTHWAGQDLAPAWSPDGRQIVFLRGVDGGLSLYTIHPNGTGLTALAAPPGSGFESAAWSPDGRSIAATGSSTDGYGNDLALLSPDGTFERDLLPLAGDLASHPQWSPAGDRVSFIRSTPCNYCDDTGNLWTVGADGSTPQQVFEGARDAAWSPDGNYFVVLRSDLLIITSQGQIVRRLRATRAAGSEGLSWQRR